VLNHLFYEEAILICEAKTENQQESKSNYFGSGEFEVDISDENNQNL
jgi:hypothetical protein